MSRIKRFSSKQAIINFTDFDIRIFVGYRGIYCSSIRIYRLPPQSSFLHMLKHKNLIWAIYNEAAICIQGWFSKDPTLMEGLTGKIVRCKDFEELKELLIDLEKMVSGEGPSGKLLEFEIEDSRHDA